MSTEQQPQPTVITLDDNNSLDILIKYIELANSKGAYQLAEAEIIKRSVDVLQNNAEDHEISQLKAKDLLLQAVHVGQKHGAFTLNDASLLFKVTSYIISSTQNSINQAQTAAAPQSVVAPVSAAPVSEPVSDNVSAPAPVEEEFDLAEPIPLKPKEV